MSVRISLLFASLHVLLYLVLTFRVIVHRRSARIGMGNGGDPALARKLRVHGNFNEYVPLALLMMGLLELAGAAAPLLWTCGVALLAGRLWHLAGLGRSGGYSAGRVGGTMLTVGALLVMALSGLLRVVPALLG